MKQRVRVPITLTVDPRSGFKLVGDLEVSIRVKQSVLQMAMANGFEPEEVGNIIGQKLDAVNPATLEAILDEA